MTRNDSGELLNPSLPPRVTLEKGDTLLLFQSFIFTFLKNVCNSPPCHHHSFLKFFSHFIASVLVSPNTRFGGALPSLIRHQVLARVLTKKSQWLASPLLWILQTQSLVTLLSDEDLRCIPTSQLHTPPMHIYTQLCLLMA